MYRAPPAPSPLVVAAFGSRVVAVQRRTGITAWIYQHAVSTTKFVRLVTPPGLVVVAGLRMIICLVYDTGALVWSSELPVLVDTILLDGYEIFVGGAGELAALDVATGAVLWHHPFDGFGLDPLAIAVPGHAAQVDNDR